MPTISQAASSSAPALLAQDLHKVYGKRPALQGLSFSLGAGRIMGFLGPNGAGKTTAIRILTTILEPSAGRFSVAGISSQYPQKIRGRIGVLPESLGFPRHMTGIEFLVFFGQLYGRTAAAARRAGGKLLKEVGLDRRATSLISSYSRGMRQRLGIARALVNDPAVLFLDEPTLGLDPRGQQEMLALVRRIAQERGVSVVVCSHALSEIEEVCDDVVILNAGRVVAAGTVAEVLEHTGQRISPSSGVRIRVGESDVASARQILGALPAVRGVAVAQEGAGWLHVTLAEPTPDYNQLLTALIQANIGILGFDAGRARLQDVFLHLTERTIA